MAAFQPYIVPQYRTTTLNVVGGIDNSQTTAIKLTAIPSDVTITDPGIVCITYANPIDTATAEWITYTSIDGTNVLQGVTRGAEGWSAKAHLNGATVAWVFSKSHVNQIMDALRGTTTGISLNLADNNGTKQIIDADADTSMTADTDDQIDWELGGADRFRMKTSDFDVVTATGNIQVAGADPKRGIYIPAAALTPATTTGCSALTQYESTTNKVNYKSLDFDGATEEYAWLLAFQAPDYWDLSTVTVRFHWTCASGSGDVIWGAAGIALSNDDAIDTALGTAQTVTDTVITALDVHTTSNTSAITIGGTPAKGDLLFLRVYRDADAGGDTLNGVDARLIGITIKFGIGQYDDQ